MSGERVGRNSETRSNQNGERARKGSLRPDDEPNPAVRGFRRTAGLARDPRHARFDHAGLRSGSGTVAHTSCEAPTLRRSRIRPLRVLPRPPLRTAARSLDGLPSHQMSFVNQVNGLAHSRSESDILVRDVIFKIRLLRPRHRGCDEPRIDWNRIGRPESPRQLRFPSQAANLGPPGARDRRRRLLRVHPNAIAPKK